MASATNFNTRNNTFRQLMGNGLSYRVPPFQRDYSWTDEEWEDLWLDILGTVHEGGEPAHYMGYLVLQTHDERSFDVIDGQQRLTTLSLIVLAVLKNLQRLVDGGIDAERNQLRIEQIRQSYIGYLDPVTLLSQSKLTLNRNNNDYYQTYIIPLGNMPQRGFRASEHGLRKAFEWFDARLREYVQSRDDDKGVALAAFVETMSDRLFFTVITVTDELNAYKVFETLNARGVRLSATDLLKNYLFSVLHRERRHENDLKALEDRWEGMVGRLGSESFPDFLRMHWNSRRSFVRQTELFKTIRGQVGSPGNVFALLREMDEDLENYLALTQPEISGWPRELQGLVSLLRLFSVRQPFPLLMATRRVMDDSAFGQVLRACVMISFRYNVIGGLSAGEQERLYSAVTKTVVDGTRRRPGDVIAALRPVYPADAQFRAAFAEKLIRTTQPRNARIVRYLLCEIEQHMTGAEPYSDSDALSIEHVLPQSPEAGWEAFRENEVENFVYRLGNMTLMEKGRNRDLGNVDYATKRAVYATSQFEITKKLAEDNDEWTPDRLANRQRWMANQATSIWRVAQLDQAGSR